MARPGSGFVSISDYLGANQGTLANEHDALAGLVGGEYDTAKSAADQVIGAAQPGTDYTATPGYSAAVDQINTAQQDQTALGTLGGVQDLLQRQYGANASQAGFDAGLLGTQQMNNPDLMAYLNTGAASNARPYAQAPALPGTVGLCRCAAQPADRPRRTAARAAARALPALRRSQRREPRPGGRSLGQSKPLGRRRLSVRTR
jgi:hypothetical protein